MPDEGPKGYETKRSLERVLDHHKCKEYKFDLTNTLMIDSEAVKIRDYKKNSIAIKPYDLDDVTNPTEDQSKILSLVRDYVLEMMDDAEDVQEYLSAHKPSFSLWEEELVEKSKEATKSETKVDDVTSSLVELEIKEDSKPEE